MSEESTQPIDNPASLPQTSPAAVLTEIPTPYSCNIPNDLPQPAAYPRGLKTRFNPETARLAAFARHTAQPSPAPDPQHKDPFTTDQRDTVRAQMKRLNGLMKEEADPQKLDRLASAYAKLAEQERILDGRPLPGSHRPSAGPTRRQSAANMPQPID
jgi:hypothetical protein